MTKSEKISQLASALVAAQSQFAPVVKGESATIAKKNGGSFSYKYCDLACVVAATRTALIANGLCLMQFPTTEGNKVIVTTMLTHISGEFISETISMAVQMDTPQSIGSAITYARRYSMMAALGLAAEDDDGQAASAKKPVKATEPAKTQEPVGYTEFKLSMILAGRKGLAELKAAWESSNREFQRHAKGADAAWWSSLKETTGAVAVVAA